MPTHKRIEEQRRAQSKDELYKTYSEMKGGLKKAHLTKTLVTKT